MPAVFNEANVLPGCSSPFSHDSHAAISFFKSGAGVSKLIASAYGARTRSYADLTSRYTVLTAAEDLLGVVRRQCDYDNRQADTKECRAC